MLKGLDRTGRGVSARAGLYGQGMSTSVTARAGLKNQGDARAASKVRELMFTPLPAQSSPPAGPGGQPYQPTLTGRSA